MALAVNIWKDESMAGDTPKRGAANRASHHPKIGSLLRDRRNYHNWTLTDVSQMTGISVSALSKIENDAMSPTYSTILQLCEGLKIEIADLLNPTVGNTQNSIMGRRSISRQHEGNSLADDNYAYTYLCSDVAHKRIIPMVVTVRARTLEDIGDLWAHVGEEYIYVLSGTLTLLTALYEPSELHPGDSVYIDSSMPHAYLSSGEADAEILVNCSSATPNLAQTLREMLKERLSSGGTKAEQKSPMPTRRASEKKRPGPVPGRKRAV
jgi:transcriptional regulator with XRE-family HTH domain